MSEQEREPRPIETDTKATESPATDSAPTSGTKSQTESADCAADMELAPSTEQDRAAVDAGTLRAQSRPPSSTANDGALFSAEYSTDLPLLTSYVDLLVGDKQRRFALIMAGIDFVLAIVVAIASAPMWPIALVLAAIGVGMFWYRGNVCRLTATKMLRGLDPAELHRHVHIYEDHVTLVKDDGSADDFPVSELTDVMHNGELLVLAFGRSGVTVPHGSLTKGTYEGLLAWALERVPGPGGAESAAASPAQDNER